MSDVSASLKNTVSLPAKNSFQKSNACSSGSMGITREEISKFVAGGISGTLAKGTVSPFDRIKILRQGEHRLYGDLSLLQAVKQVVKNEGVLQLWRGLPALVIRIFPYAGIQFFSNDKYRLYWKDYEIKKEVQIGNVNVPIRNLMCGSMAGLTATSITYPLDLIRTRILYTSSNEKGYKNFRSTCKTIYNQPGGITNFYAGIRPALIGMVFYAGLSFGTYETLREKALEGSDKFLIFELKNENGELYYLTNLFMGSAAALISQLLVFPIDTARRRMQNAQLITTQNNLKDKMSVYLTLRDLWRRSPNPYFPTLIYRGFALNVLRAVPSAAISFATHDHLRNFFGVPRRS